MASVGLPLLVLVLYGWWSLAERQYFLIDDSYITFRYAVNLAHGHGLVWNVGERVEGYTNLLWVLLMAVFAKFQLDLMVPSAVSSLIFAAGCIVLLERISRVLRPSEGLLTHLVPGLLLATNPSFANAATSGMESSCFAFFALLGLFLLIRGREDPRLARWVPAVFCAAYLTRPEGALICGIALLVEVASRPEPLPQRLRALAPTAIAMAALVMVHLLVRRAYYGFWLPNTFYAKVIFGQETILRGATHVARFMLAGGWLAVPGVLELYKPGPSRPWFIHGYCLFFAYITYLVAIGGDFPFWFRFYIPLLPLPLLATSHLMRRIGAALRSLVRRPLSANFEWGLSAAAAVATVAGLNGMAARFGEHREVLGRLEPEVAYAQLFVRDFFVREAPRGALVAAQVVGHLGYHARHLRIVDMWGLNDAHIAHVKAEPGIAFGHDKTDIAYVSALKPDYRYELHYSFDKVKIPGYDLCWPSTFYPFAVYRRNVSLSRTERRLGVPKGARPRLQLPPPCEPPGIRQLARSPPIPPRE